MEKGFERWGAQTEKDSPWQSSLAAQELRLSSHHLSTPELSNEKTNLEGLQIKNGEQYLPSKCSVSIDVTIIVPFLFSSAQSTRLESFVISGGTEA